MRTRLLLRRLGVMGGILFMGVVLIMLVAQRTSANQSPQVFNEPLPLALFPQPPRNNGMGMHFSPAAARVETEVVDIFVHELQTLGMTWTIVLNDGLTPQQDELVARLVGAGIEPIVRIYTLYNEPLDSASLKGFVAHYRRMGVHYFQLYNEPNLIGQAGGWRDGESISVDHMVTVWLPAARAVQEAGGIPTIPPLAPGGHYDDIQFFTEFLTAIQARGETSIFYGEYTDTGEVLRYPAVLNFHNYGLGHPPMYPNDPVAQGQQQLVTDEELAIYGVDRHLANVSEVEWWRSHHQTSNRPDGGMFRGDSIDEDSNGFRKYEAYYNIFTRMYGFEIPLLGTEGGWAVGENPDKRYLPVTPDIQSRWTLEAYACVATRSCSIPDAVFVHMTWIQMNFAGNGVTENFEHQALYKKRCYTMSPPVMTRPDAPPPPLCQEGDALPVVWSLATFPLKTQTLAPLAYRSAWLNQQQDAPLLAHTDDTLRFNTEEWSEVQRSADEAGMPPLTYIKSQHANSHPDAVYVEEYRYAVTVPEDAPLYTTWGEGQMRVTNVAATTVTISIQDTLYSLAPQGSAVVIFPADPHVVIPVSSPTESFEAVSETIAPTTAPSTLTYHVSDVYHLTCDENGMGTTLQVFVEDEQGNSLDGVMLEFNTQDGNNPVFAVSGQKAPGMTEFALVAAGGGIWKVRVAPQSGGSAWAENLSSAWTDDCPGEANEWGHHSYRVRLQRGLAPSVQVALTEDGVTVLPPDSAENPVRPLDTWVRPENDTGLGLHYVPVGNTSAADVRVFIADLKRMHMTWATVLYSSDEMLRTAAPLFQEAGIVVVWRPFLRADDIYPADAVARDLAILRDAGMPPYIQLYNEPEFSVEWNDGQPEDWREQYLQRWINAAATVQANGGWTGIQTTDPDLLTALVRRLRDEHPNLLQHTFFVAHAYGSNHPPDYPYDALNQAENTGDTIEADWTGMLGFMKFARVFEREVGFVPPIIIGEGGWTVGVQEDDRYPRITADLHRDYHREVAEWFRVGTLPMPEQRTMPPYLFGVTWWLYKQHPNSPEFSADAWFDSSLNGTLDGTIQALEEMPPFTR